VNYQQLYVNLLKTHGTKDKPEEYSERHHILPKSLGGTDDSDNLIYVSARVHFIAHWLLYKIHNCEKTARAFYGMCDSGRKPERQITSVQYEHAKKAFSKYNHMKLPFYKNLASVSAKKQWKDNYEGMKKSNSFMFKDENHPMFMKNKTGDLHPRSKAVITPLGRFGSVRLAGKAHDLYHSVISRYCKSNEHPDFYYE